MWHQHHVPLSRVLTGEDVGLLPIGDGRWTVYFGSFRLGQFDERLRRIQTAT
jgi:hypothetical protein